MNEYLLKLNDALTLRQKKLLRRGLAKFTVDFIKALRDQEKGTNFFYVLHKEEKEALEVLKNIK